MTYSTGVKKEWPDAWIYSRIGSSFLPSRCSRQLWSSKNPTGVSPEQPPFDTLLGRTPHFSYLHQDQLKEYEHHLRLQITDYEVTVLADRVYVLCVLGRGKMSPTGPSLSVCILST